MPTQPTETGARLALIRILPWAILCLGLALTYVLQDATRHAARQSRQDEFNFRVDEIVGNINKRMHNYEQVLSGAAGLFAASQPVGRGEFRAYVSALKLAGKYPGIQGVGFALLVPPGDKGRHVEQIRQEGFPGYNIRPEGDRDIYTPIVFLEPFDWRNQRAFGYDMFAQPTRRAAMAQARDESSTIISGKVKLLQETEKDSQPGFLMYVPVYRNHAPIETPEQRRANLVGWVYAPFRMNDLMKGILGQHFGEIKQSFDLEIHDGDAAVPDKLMYDSEKSADKAAAAFKVTKSISLFGHDWTVTVYSMPAFDAQVKSEKALIIALSGSAGSVLLALVVWLLVTARASALVVAEDMTRALHLLSDCNMTLVQAEDEHKLLAEICRLIVERGGYLMAWVGYAEQDEARTVRPIAEFGFEDGYLDTVDITWADSERGQGPTGTSIRNGRTEINQNVLINPRMAPWREAAIKRGYQSSISLPLVNEGKVLGALAIYARAPLAFNPEEVRLLEELAGDLAFGIVTLRTRTERAAAEARASFLAHYDPLTHLPNHLLLRDRFAQALAISEHEQSGLALLYLDMDNFQQVNDSLGHDVGDQLLVKAVERLQHCLRDTDTISRQSGDEFTILLSSIGDFSAVARIAGNILNAFAEPISIGEHVLNTSFSIGISLMPNDGLDFDTLLKKADTAVYHAKGAGRNTYRFFTRKMNEGALEQIRLQGQLHSAVKNQEFLLHYQPQIDIGSGRIVGAEALVRWQHPLDGLVSPARFIPLAEDSGHIIQIGEWVLNEACRQARAWQDLGLDPVVMAVNLSALQFKRGNVLEMTKAALLRSGLAPAHLELELTESILLQDVETTMQTLDSLKALGVRLSIDDFGTGYSSLSYLKRLAVDKLKIDQSFVRDLVTDAGDAAIVKAVIQLGQALQLSVIAEGVETEAQLAFLANAGCDEIQGYLFSRPVPAAEFAALLEKGSLAPA
ncbi:hypothetical protein SKTS_35280 [Sulfurimicrobium lacus]|uniref:Bifunctional diguanylate cyclase/phosphodiesterase n=1 Tax=Sulfurimicrobium lacus TaxID=2715678 RepID=A0A6F8VI77_9PROT|nr:EAL domain-containing protein [Sulfurimicrobium lacus]BCB28642.1 hypothetical protein SKTS_35280 [Sulfurimicrobium lacus]